MREIILAFSNALVKHSDLDWIIFRLGAFADGERTQQYHHGFTSSDYTSKLKISRADVADLMLKRVTDDVYLHQTPALSC